jgi:SAM-dependent methyltransferase
MDRFLRLKKQFQQFDKELKEKFLFTVRDTEKGIWGPSSLDIVCKLFKKIRLQKYKHFLDIGCGDGRVALAASLFTNATGIEIDRNLIKKGDQIKKKLNLNADLICGDYFKHNFSKYDIIFTNPDTGFYNGLEDKLMKEMKGALLVYNNIFMPRFLKRGKTHWFEQVPITEFTAQG